MQQLGLIVSIRDAFTRDAKRIQREMDKLGNSALRSGKRITEAFRGPISFTPLRNALLGVSFAMFALNKTVSLMTGAFSENEQALVRLDQATLRWGRNATQVNAEVNRLVTSGALNQARAATAVTNLLQGRFNEAQIRTFNRGLQDIVAAGLAPGQNFDEVFLRVTQGIKTGNLGQLEALGIPNIAERFRLLGGDPSDLIKPFRQEIGRGILFTILEQEFSAVEGRFEEFINSLRGQTLVLNNELQNTRVAIGRALEPIVLAFTKTMIKFVKSVELFVQKNPKFVEALLVVAVTLPILLLGFAALKIAIFATGAAMLGATLPLLILVGGFIALGLFLRRNKDPFGPFTKKGIIERFKSIVFFIQAIVQALFSMRDGTLEINEGLARELDERGLIPAFLKTIRILLFMKDAFLAFASGVFIALEPVIFIVGKLAEFVGKMITKFFEGGDAGERFAAGMDVARKAGIIFGVILSALVVKSLIGLGATLVRVMPLLFAMAIPFLKVLAVIEAVNFAINAIVIGMKGLVSVASLVGSLIPGGRTFAEQLPREAKFLSGGAFGTEGEGFGLFRRSTILAGGRTIFGEDSLLENLTSGFQTGPAAAGGSPGEAGGDLADKIAAAMRAAPMIFNGTIMLDGREIGFSVDEQDELRQAQQGIPAGG